MPVSTEKLLALKAFYMGHAIAEKHIIKPTALAMVNAAIAHYQNSQETPEKIRLAFYYMLRAEILRHEGTPTDDRREAQRICNEIGSSQYEYFMAIENATHSTESYRATDGLVSWEVKHDIATLALGVSERDITYKQIRFLELATLKDMLDKHGVKYAP